MTAGSLSGIINTSPSDKGKSLLTSARGFGAARNNPVHRSQIMKRFGEKRSTKNKTIAAAAAAAAATTTPNSTMALLTSTGKFQQSQQHELDGHGQRLHSRTLFDDEDDGMMHMSVSNDENDSNTNISESNDESQLSNDSDDLEFEFESDFDMTLSYDSTNNDDRTFDNDHEDGDDDDDDDDDDDEFGEERTLSDGDDSMSYLDLDLSLDGSHDDFDEDELEILHDDEQDDEPYAGQFLEQAFENMGLISKDPEKEDSALILSTGAAVDNLYRRMSRSVSRSMTSSSFGSSKKLLRVISFKRKKSTARNEKKNEDEDEDDDYKLYERARSEDLLSKSKSLSRRKNNKQQQQLQKKLSQVQKKISAQQKRLRHLRRFDKDEAVEDDEGKNNINNNKNVGIIDVDEYEYGNDKNEDTTSTGDGDGDGGSDDRTVELIHSFSTEESGTDSPGRKPGDNRNGNGRVLVRVVGTGDDSQDDENKDKNEGVEQDDDDYDEERCGGNGDCSSVATGFINLFPKSTVASCKDVAHCATETEMLGNEMLEDVMDPIQQQQVVTVLHEKFTAPCSDSSPLKSTSRSSSRSSSSKIPGNIKNKINKWFTRCAGDIDIASPSSVADVGGGLCGSTDVTTCTDTITATAHNGVVVGRWSTSNTAYDHFDGNDEDDSSPHHPKSPPRPKRLPKPTKNLLSFSRVVSSTLLSSVDKIAARGSGRSAYGGINNEDGPNATATSTDTGRSATSNAVMACGEGAMINCLTDDTDFGTEINPIICGTPIISKRLPVRNPSIVIDADASSMSSLATSAVRGRSSQLNGEESAKFVLPPKRPVDVVPSAPSPAAYDDVENDYDTDIINSDAALLQAEAKSLANNLMIQKNKIQKTASRTISRIINNNKKNAAYKSTTTSSSLPSNTTTTVAADARAFTKAMFSSSSSSNNHHHTANNDNNKDGNVVNNNDCITTAIVLDDDEVDVSTHPFDEMNTMKDDEFFSPSNPQSCVGCSSSVRFAADVEDFIDDDDGDEDNDNHNDIHTTTPTLSSSASYHNYLSSDDMSKHSNKAEVNGSKSPSALTRITTVTVTGASPSSYGQSSLLDSNVSDDNEPPNNDDFDDELGEEVLNEDEMIEMTEEDNIADAFTTKTEVDVEGDGNSAPIKKKKPSGSSSLKRWTSSRRTTKSDASSSKKKRKPTSVVADSEKSIGGGFDSDVNVSSNNDACRITSFIRDEDGFAIEMTAITSSSSSNEDKDEQDQQQLQKYDNEDEVLIEVPRRTRTYDEPLVIDTKDPLLLLEDIHIHTQTQKNQQEQLDIQEEQADETGKKDKKAKAKRKDRRWSKRLNIKKMNSFQQQEHTSMNGNKIIIEVEESSSVFDYGIVEQSHHCDEDNNTGFEVACYPKMIS